MAQLIVRNVPGGLVALLKQQAANRGHSAEAEHREILKHALMPSKGESFRAMLWDIPKIGRDSDFVRPRRLGRRVAI